MIDLSLRETRPGKSTGLPGARLSLLCAGLLSRARLFGKPA